MSISKHDSLCPFPQHSNDKICTYCALIRKGRAFGYVDGRSDAAKDVREFLMMRFGVAYVNTVNDAAAVAEGIGIRD